VIAIASWKIRKANAHLREQFSSILSLAFASLTFSQAFATLCNYEAIAS